MEQSDDQKSLEPFTEVHENVHENSELNVAAQDDNRLSECSDFKDFIYDISLHRSMSLTAGTPLVRYEYDIGSCRLCDASNCIKLSKIIRRCLTLKR